MASVINAPQQHKQPSRKGKKAWRKNVDVSAVEEGLEVVREEIITGGILAEKPSDALFTLDSIGSDAIQKSCIKIYKPLKSDQILALRSVLPAVESHKRSRVTDGVLEPNTKRQKRNGVSFQEYERLKRIAIGRGTISKNVIKSDGAPDHDPWALTGTESEHDPRFTYLEKPKPIKAPPTLKEPPVSLLLGGEAAPAVSEPRDGASYNPVFQEWSQLLIKEGEKEVEAEKKRLRAMELERELEDRIAAAQCEKDGNQTEDESAWEGFESEYENSEWLRKRRPERKTPAERNKVKRRKAAERQRRLELQMKRMAQQAQQIKSIARNVNDEANARMLAKVQGTTPSSVVAADEMLRRRKLGKHSLPEPPLELVLPDELQDSLRRLKPEGNLLKDRFRNILVRGRMETRNPIQQPRKAKRTLTEKWTYKDFQISV